MPAAPQPEEPPPFRGSKYFSTPLLLTLRLRKEVRKGMAEPEPQLVRRSMRADAPQQAAAEALARLVVILQRAYAPPPDTTGWFDAWPRGWPWNPAWTATPDSHTWAADPAYFEERCQRRRARDWLQVRVVLLPAHLHDPELLVALMKAVRRLTAAVPRVARKAPRTPADDCGWGADTHAWVPLVDTRAWRAQQKQGEARRQEACADAAAAAAGAQAGQPESEGAAAPCVTRDDAAGAARVGSCAAEAPSALLAAEAPPPQRWAALRWPPAPTWAAEAAAVALAAAAGADAAEAAAARTARMAAALAPRARGCTGREEPAVGQARCETGGELSAGLVVGEQAAHPDASGLPSSVGAASALVFAGAADRPPVFLHVWEIGVAAYCRVAATREEPPDAVFF